MPDLAVKISDKPPKVDGRVKNGAKLDLGEVIKLRDVQGLSFPKIGSILKYTPQYIERAYVKFKGLVQDTDINQAFNHNRTNILNSLELGLLQDLSSPDKRAKASLNNTAYAFDKIHNARRLEQGLATGGGVTVTIEIAYQEAQDQAKQLRLKHAGSSTITDNDQDKTE